MQKSISKFTQIRSSITTTRPSWTTFTTSEHPAPTSSDEAYRQCRFGNFIGEAEESEDESQHSVKGYDAYVYDDEADEDGAPNDQQLMEIDG